MAFVQLGSFNAAYQLVSGYIGIGSTTLPATGAIRLENNAFITSIFSGTDRNVAWVDTNGYVNFGDSNAKTRILSSTAGAVEIFQSGTRRFYFSGTNFVIEAGALYLPGGIFVSTGSGSPEGVVTAPIGSLYVNTAGGATTTLYVKTSGAGNTGWTAK